MKYIKIIDKFQEIKSVDTHSTKPILVVTGYIDGEIKSEKFEYQHYKVMTAVAEKVSYFIGIK